DTGSQQLGARVQQRIAQGGAEADGLLDGRDAPIRIENGKWTDQAPECVDSRGWRSSVGGPRRRLVGVGALDPRPAPVVCIAYALQQLDLQRAAGVGCQRAKQGSGPLEHPDRVAVGETSSGVLRRQDEVADRSMMIAPLLEVPCQ